VPAQHRFANVPGRESGVPAAPVAVRAAESHTQDLVAQEMREGLVCRQQWSANELQSEWLQTELQLLWIE
jgi:hypothetical protein